MEELDLKDCVGGAHGPGAEGTPTSRHRQKTRQEFPRWCQLYLSGWKQQNHGWKEEESVLGTGPIVAAMGMSLRHKTALSIPILWWSHGCAPSSFLVGWHKVFQRGTGEEQSFSLRNLVEVTSWSSLPCMQGEGSGRLGSALVPSHSSG